MDTTTATIEVIPMLVQLTTLLTTVFGAVWYLSTRLERMKVQIESQTELFCERFRQIDKELDAVKKQIDETRRGRVELWSEVNALRERVSVAETQLGRRSNKGGA